MKSAPWCRYSRSFQRNLITSSTTLFFILTFGILIRAQTESVTRVWTTAELLAAIERGAQHIVVQAHLSLEESDSDINLGGVLFSPVSTTVSIQGNCSEASPPSTGLDPAIPPLSPAQCLLLVGAQGPVLQPLGNDVALWLHNVAIRLTNCPPAPAEPQDAVVFTNGIPRLWMTSVTIQGDGNGQCRGFYVKNSGSLYARGGGMYDLSVNAEDWDIELITAAAVGFRTSSILQSDPPTTLYFNGTTFANITTPGSSGSLIYFEYAHRLAFDECSFQSNEVKSELVYSESPDGSSGPSFYASPEMQVFNANTGTEEATLPLSEAGGGKDDEPFLSEEDEWFFEAQQSFKQALAMEAAAQASAGPTLAPSEASPRAVTTPAAATTPATATNPALNEEAAGEVAGELSEETAPAPAPASTQSTQTLAVAVAVTAVTLLVAFAVTLIMRRRGKCRLRVERSEPTEVYAEEDVELNEGGSLPFTGGASPLPSAHAISAMSSESRGGRSSSPHLHRNSRHSSSGAYTRRLLSSDPSPHISSTRGSLGVPSVHRTATTGTGTLSTLSTLPRGRNGARHTTSTHGYSSHMSHSLDLRYSAQPGHASAEGESGAELEAGVSGLTQALDDMYTHHELFMGEYAVQNFMARRRGGQGVVQFVVRERDGAEFAVKFFVDLRTFECELELYENPRLAGVLPAVECITANRNSELRSADGFVFPPFIMVEKGESLNEWAFRSAPDFATTLFVLLHVGQRLLQLHDNGIIHRDLKPANILWLPASKSWTIIDYGCAADTGSDAPLLFSIQYAAPEVIAAAERGEETIVADAAVDVWALGLIAFELLTRSHVVGPGAKEQMLAMLTGRAHFPWEDTTRKRTALPKLRALKRSVLLCLSRDPSARPSARDVLASWNGLLEGQLVAPPGS